jgi:enediyne biosynthesis protein E4
VSSFLVLGMPRLGHFLSAIVLSVGACRGADDERRVFKLLDPERTGVTFANTVHTNDSVNVQSYYFVYNGAGVAVGDIDNDGLADLFFTGNTVSSRLYLNKGDMRFEDITGRAGVHTDRWAGGASMVDINDDGYLDIYVSVYGPEWLPPAARANLLFVNNGDRTFTDAAEQYGIADTGFSTHSAFLDYDRDGDLDLFVLNNSPVDFARGEAERHPLGVPSHSPGTYDQLYRNNGDNTFTNVSAQAGIVSTVGFGLGVAVGDLNRDGWPDIYVSNDDTPNDVLYVNNGDGTFTDRAGAWIKHASFAGMGVDVADFNNDGWPDILQSDMMPPALPARKRMSGAMTYGALTDFRRKGFRDDYQVNTLQLSSGITPQGDVIFSDIARMAGVAYTDWSWTSLFGDYDNDGFKDILITNGYPKAANDFDYQVAMYAEKRRGGDPKAAQRRGLEILRRLHGYHVPNYVFRNAGDLTFVDRTRAWGMEQPSYSYGAAHADLDNDGRLDVVVSNIDAPAFVYRNVGPDDDAHHFLRVTLEGQSPNRGGIGAEVTLTAGGQKQVVYHTPYRGYMSSMEPRVHFGLGGARRVDSLEVVWPDGRYQLLTNLDVDRMVVVRQSEASRAPPPGALPPPDARPFTAQQGGRGLIYRHQAASQVDYTVQPLLPYMLSRQGPALAVGDLTGDGLEDLFVGGSVGAPPTLFEQRRDGSFATSALTDGLRADSISDDWGAAIFDANGDGRQDIYVASGGYHYAPTSPELHDRLYLNTEKGFERATAALPSMLTSTSAVRVGDFSGDGRPDLFVGGRLTPRRYPYPARSYLLRNEGGRFIDVTKELAPELAEGYGMVTDAVWADFDGDGRLDLITAGEWMSLRFHRNEGTRFRDITASTGIPALRGWWYSLAAGDFDGDGDPDLLAGNLGLNHGYSTSRASPFGVYAADFTGNQTIDVVLTQEIDGQDYPVLGKSALGRAIYTLALRYPTYGSFAQASMLELFGAEPLAQALRYQADTFASMYLENTGGGRFRATPLPNLAQIAPVRAIVADDVDGDGHLDGVLAGNVYDVEPNTPRADAGNGLWLKGDGRGTFAPAAPMHSGFLAPRNVSGLAVLHTPNGRLLVAANTGDSLQVFALPVPNDRGSPSRVLR